MSDSDPSNPRLPFPAVVLIAALAIFGTVTAAQWVFSSLVTIVKFSLVLVVVVAAVGWVISAKASR